MLTFRVVHEAGDQWRAKRGFEVVVACAAREEAIAVAKTSAALVAPSEVILHNPDGRQQVVYSNVPPPKPAPSSVVS